MPARSYARGVPGWVRLQFALVLPWSISVTPATGIGCQADKDDPAPTARAESADYTRPKFDPRQWICAAVSAEVSNPRTRHRTLFELRFERFCLDIHSQFWHVRCNLAKAT